MFGWLKALIISNFDWHTNTENNSFHVCSFVSSICVENKWNEKKERKNTLKFKKQKHNKNIHIVTIKQASNHSINQAMIPHNGNGFDCDGIWINSVKLNCWTIEPLQSHSECEFVLECVYLVCVCMCMRESVACRCIFAMILISDASRRCQRRQRWWLPFNMCINLCLCACLW